MKKLCMILSFVLILCFMVGCQDKEAMAELDFNKLVLEMIKAIEDRDFKKICLLSGMKYTEKAEHRFNDKLDEVNEEELASYLEKFHLFPEIGEIPEWISYTEFRFQYLEDNKEITLKAFFDLKDNTWHIIDFLPDTYKLKELTVKEMKRMSDRISSPPPEGKKTLDAGLNEIIQKFVSDFKEKNWESMKRYTPWYRNLDRLSELKKKDKKFGELLSDFPTIGPIPAPAIMVDLILRGKSEEKWVKIAVRFEWRDETLRIAYISVKY